MAAGRQKKNFIEIRGVEKALGTQAILRGVDLEVAQGETLVIIGASGGGKSVLLKHILGLMRPDAGHITVDGESIDALNERELFPVRRKIGMLFQDGALFDSYTVGENVAFPLHQRGERNEATIDERVQESLTVVGLAEHSHKMPVELSGGMRKRVALARAIVTRPRCILYDEPTAGLDPIMADSINKLVRRLQHDFGVSAVLVTHDMESAYHVADRIAYLHQGRIRQEGTPAQIRDCDDPLVQNFIHGRSGDSQ